MFKKYIFSLVLASAAFGGCNKFIDIEPSHELDGEKSFKSLDDIEFQLIGTYATMRNGNWFGEGANPFFTMAEILSDNVYETSASLSELETVYTWTYEVNDGRVENIFKAGYTVILNANSVINKVEQFRSENPERANRLKAQALTIRAMAHFDLMRYYASEFNRNSTVLGVPYVKVADTYGKPARATVKQNYDDIYTDLNEALDLFQDVDQAINAGNRSYVDQWVAQALLARISLYNESYDDAIQYASNVITRFPLANRAQYPGIWTDASLNEVIWSYNFGPNQGRIGSNIYWAPARRLSYSVVNSVLDEYDEENDIRFSSFFNPNFSPNFMGIKKIISKEAAVSNPDGIINYKVFRTSEMYLIRAEAQLKKANPDEAAALDDLNALRAARIDGFTAGTETGTDLEEAIELERRKELVLEGHRFFDLKRTTKTLNRENCSVYCTLTPNDRQWTFPIPQIEILTNENIGDQNPGY